MAQSPRVSFKMCKLLAIFLDRFSWQKKRLPVAQGASPGTELRGKRIIFVLGWLDLGGAERQALLLARHLVYAHGAHVQVWGFSGSGLGRAAEMCEEYRIPWHLVPLSEPPEQLIRQVKEFVTFVWRLRRARPDILLPYTARPNILCGVLWRWVGARLCVWNQRDEGRGLDERKVIKWSIHHTPLIVSNSQHGADYLMQKFEAKPRRIHVIHNGVEIAVPKSDCLMWRRQLGVGPDCFLACMVANLHTHKDHATLLRAWRTVADCLRADGRSGVLLLAGRFDDAHHQLEALAYDLELGKSVRFLGLVKDISGLLSEVDLGVFSSQFEGCPNGVLECMGSGLAVVGTDIPGIREAMGSTGYPFLAPVEDAEALADRILYFANNAEMRTKIGTANRRRVAADFNPVGMCDEIVGLICDALK